MSSAKANIFDIKRYAIHDGPGIRTTVFFKGCPLRCPWCHNPESIHLKSEIMHRPARCIRCGRCAEVCEVGLKPSECTLCGRCIEACPTAARQLIGREMTPLEVFVQIERDRPFYDQSGGGATLSGGEPLLQHEPLLEILRLCNEREIHTAIDTTLCASEEVVARIAPLCDLWLVDLKLADAERHQTQTGIDNGAILSNLAQLAKINKVIWIRIPILPEVNDDQENIDATGRLLASFDSIERVELLPYHRPGEKALRLVEPMTMQQYTMPSPERMEEIAARLVKFGLPVI